MAKGKKKGPVNVFARLAKYQDAVSLPQEPVEESSAELGDTELTIIPPIPFVEVQLNLQFRCSVPIIEGDVLQVSLPGFKGKASVFTPQNFGDQGTVTSPQFLGYWSGEGMKREKKAPPKHTLLLKCIRRIELHQLVVLTIPPSVGLTSPNKLAANSSKIKIGGTVVHSLGGKLLKQVILSTTEIRKRPVEEEISDYRGFLTDIDQKGGLKEIEQHIAEELSVEELDNLWEAAHDRCPYPLGLQWHIAISAFHEYENSGPILKAIMEKAIECIKSHDNLCLQREIATNLGVKIGAVVAFQDMLYTLYGAMYPYLLSSVLLAVRLFTMEPIDIARTFLCEPPQLSVAQEIYSCFRIEDIDGLHRWGYTIAALLLITDNNEYITDNSLEFPDPPVLYFGLKELPQEELRLIREMEEGSSCIFPCFTTARPDVSWEDEEAFAVPDNAVLFEMHNVSEALEICDLSMYPYDAEWLLPLCSSFSVVSVKVYDDRNSLTHVVLESHGCLHGSAPNDLIPEEDKKVAKVVSKKLRLELKKMDYLVRYVANHTYLNVRLNERLRLSPQTLVRAQYVDHYFEIKRHSQAKMTVEDGSVNWQVCTNPAQVTDPVEGVVKHAAWESMPRKFALLAEQSFLSRTRVKKVFELNGIVLNFTNYTCDYGGKGPRSMRRIVKKRVSHEAPLPALSEIIK
ncbi:hypothetical protein ERJ75_001598500 [Trypanosoma vivax]|nr:hypothetical protein TRVL_03485 [Trypanosoma vivax]KAH8605490.1 hypothetical protein ERJ75_001598500 [Trypanosoma vivax]